MTTSPSEGPSAASSVVRVFGGIGVDGPEGPIRIGGPRQRRLLALFALRAGSAVSVDWLAEHLWDDDDRPSSPGSAMRTYVSRLRRALPESAQDWIGTEPSGYRSNVPTEALEHRRFSQLRNEATTARGRGDPLVAQELLTEALALWRGDPFPELEELDVGRPEIEQLRLDRLEMLEERWEAALALGRHTQITGELAVFATEHRLRDRSTRQYALALHRSGRTAEGLRVIADHRSQLADESGLDPSLAMVDLEQAMLTGDDSLGVEKVGRPLRGYRLLDEIGSGAFSVVWRGMQPSVGREVAIKQIRSELASQPEFIRRFEAEAHLIARIEHPHIVPLIDFWRDPDSAYLVMRYLRGGTLELRLDDGAMPVEATLTVAKQIGSALTAAHEQGIIHRDVKTGNILFDEAGNAYLGDFGIALEATETDGPEAALSSGSPAYAAPEQLRRLRLGPEADVFSLGVVLFECLIGELPFTDSGSATELLDRQLNDPHPAISDLRSDVPRAVSDAIAKATSKEPTDRWPSVQDFLAALEGEAPGAQPAEPKMPVADGTNPYKGLRAFDDADARDFFGRERLVTELVERLAGQSVASRSVIVVGPSGSGKSSVVRAGLVPAVRAGAITGSDDWFVTTMVPGTDPYQSIEAALQRIAVNPPPSMLDQLTDGDRGIMRSIRRCLPSDNDRVFLVIDQFEELFTGIPIERSNQFLAALAVAVKDPASPLRLVATLRADYYHRPLAHRSFAGVLKESAVDVTPLAADELERAILEPARRYGVQFEPGLSARIAADCLSQPAPLPLLQYALAELFERRDDNLMSTAMYNDLGGLSGALAARAESLFLDATEPERMTIRRVFGQLANPGERSADLRRRVALADLASDPGAQHAIDRFGQARLLTFDRDTATREPTVEVAHEALFREWPRLAAWLDEDAELLRSVDAVAAAASTWDKAGRAPADLYRGGRLESAIDLARQAPDRLRGVDTEFVEAARLAAEFDRAIDRKTVRLLRRLVVAVGVGLVVALAAGGLAYNQQRRATNQAELAKASQSTAEAQTLLAVEAAEQAELANLVTQSGAVAADDGELSILLALEAHRQRPGPETEQAVLRALSLGTLANRLSSFPAPAGPEPGCGQNPINIYPGAEIEFTRLDGQLVSRNILTGAISEHGSPPEPCVQWMGDVGADRRLAVSPEGTLWLGSFDGPWVRAQELGAGTAWGKGGFNPAHRLIFVRKLDGGSDAVIVDDTTGETVGSEITGPGDLIMAALSPDGALGAVGFNGDTGGSSGVLVIVDARTGTELHRVAGLAATHLTFDPITQELLVGTDDRSLAVIDSRTGTIVSQFRSGASTDLLDVGLRGDGLIAMISSDEIEVFDRRTGPTGEKSAIPDSFIALLRPDGTLFTVNQNNSPAARAEVWDLTSSALSEQTIDLAGPSHAAFNGDSVVVTNFGTSDVQSIDLRTNERIDIALTTSVGETYPAIFAAQTDRGLLSLKADGHLTLWDDGVLIDEITPSTDSQAQVLGQSLDGTTILVGMGIGSVPFEMHWIDFSSGTFQLIRTVADETALIAIEADDRMHVLFEGGTMGSLDRNGAVVAVTETGLNVDRSRSRAGANSPGLVAFGGSDGAVIVELTTGKVTSIPSPPAGVSLLGFARDGAMLVVGSPDGTVRTWDVETQTLGGVIWRGREAITTGMGYDEKSDSLWIAEPERLVQLPLSPDVFLARACDVVDRGLTQEEWDLYVSPTEPLQSACA